MHSGASCMQIFLVRGQTNSHCPIHPARPLSQKRPCVYRTQKPSFHTIGTAALLPNPDLNLKPGKHKHLMRGLVPLRRQVRRACQPNPAMLVLGVLRGSVKVRDDLRFEAWVLGRGPRSLRTLCTYQIPINAYKPD